MSSGKTSSGSKDYYGHIAGLACQGQLDFTWGLMINNELVWPKAQLWDTKIYKAKTSVIFTDGNVYQASQKTSTDPNAFPWILLAIPWTAGTYNPGDKRLYLGNVWACVSTTSVAPPASAPSSKLAVQSDTVTNGWVYVSTPQTWATGSGSNFWGANSIVAWKGRLYTTPTGTKSEPPNSPWVLWKIDAASSPNPLKFTVEDRGDVYLYWGTPTQALDTVNEGILSALGHPPYRDLAFVMLKNFLFGTSQVNPPDVVLLVGRKPVQTLITGAATDFDADWNVNPWCYIAEKLTHSKIGLGLPNSFFNQTVWQAEADRCAANPQLYYISPMITSLTNVRNLVADLLGYPDAVTFFTVLALLSAGHWPHGEAAPAFTAANTIDRNDVISEIATTSNGWDDTSSSVTVSFQDIQGGFKDRPAIAQNLFNMAVTQRVNSQKFDRPFITRFEQASAWAAEQAKVCGDQKSAGNLTVRAEKASAIEPGSIFLLTNDEFGTSEPQRCTKKTVSLSKGTVTLSHETERGLSPQAYSPAKLNPTPQQGPAPATILNYAAVQLPSALAGEANTLAILAGRANDVTSSMEVWFKQADASAFQKLGTNHGFAVSGTLLATANNEINTGTPGADNATFVTVGQITQGTTYDLGETDFWQQQVFYSVNPGGFPHFTGTEGLDYTIDPSTGKLTILTGGSIPTGYYVNVKMWQKLVFIYDPATPQTDLDNISAAPTQDEIDDGQILLFAFRADNPALFEIMSVRAVQPVGLDVVVNRQVIFVEVLRTQFDSLYGGDGSYVWGTNPNDVIMIIKKSAIQPLSHQNFPFYHAAGSTISLRLAPASAWVQADIDDLYDPASNPEGLATAFDYTWNNIYAPTVTWGQLLCNGTAISSFASNFAATDVFNFSFELDSREGNLSHGALVAIQGQQEITLWASNMQPTNTQNKTVQFQLPKGNWAIQLRMLDDSGNQTSVPLTFGGSDAVIYIDNGTAQAPIVYKPSYTDHNGFRSGLTLGLLPGTGASFLVHYQIQNRNVAVNPSGWTSCTVFGSAIGGLFQWGDSTYGTLPPIKKGSSGQTIYAYCSQTGKTDSDIVKWNF